jgi:endogenous inhibitor of DNA gyrase (YacG/DUF329 family)
VTQSYGHAAAGKLEMTVKCPRCGSEATFEKNPFRPFCSERCKQIDLGKWASGVFRIAANDQEEEKQDPPSPEDDSAAK